MVKSLLVETIQKFTAEELRELQLFVASPYFNRGNYVRETQVLLAFIAGAVPDFSAPQLDRGVAYQTIFPGAPLVAGRMDKVMSELYKMVKAFISIHHYNRQGNEFQHLLDQSFFYRVRLMENRYQHVVRKMVNFQVDTPYRDLEFFQRQFALDFELHTYGVLHNRKRDDIHIQKTLESLDLHYLSLKTELLNRYLLQQKVALLKVPNAIQQAIEESQQLTRHTDEYPVLLISYTISKLLEKKQPSVAEFENLHNLLRQHEAEIQPELLKSYYTYVRNFCVLLFNGGRTELLPVLFQFQKEHYERGYMHHYGDKISATAFLNLSNVALKLGEYQWAEAFILSHETRVLDDNPTQDYYHLILANFLFHTGAFEQALDVLPSAFQDLDFHLFSRRLELKLYYELNSDLLPFKIDAFKMYLSRASQKVLSPLAKGRNANFVNLLFQLTGASTGDPARTQRLIERIREKQSVTDREWLLEKAAQLG